MASATMMLVLGMHRGGTSAVSCSLRVFGANHGENLVGGLSSNPYGHWEDLDVLRHNEHMLNLLDTRWDAISPLDEYGVRILEQQGFVESSAALLRRKIASNGFYALKEPRLTKLLPLWHKVFQSMDLQPYTLVVCRNPASVAASLNKRDGMNHRHGYRLWASYMLECFHFARESTHALVNYDAFLENPERKLRAIADFFRLPVIAAEYEMIVSNFLDAGLRHTVFDVAYLYEDKACPREVALMYEELHHLCAAARYPDGTFAAFYRNYREMLF
jgi:hypothetical protein